jgi:hypothetical protein
MAMSPGINNLGGGVDSGGARHTDWVAKPDALALLSKSLCTLQALVSNMEESGWQPIETAPKDEDVFILAKRAGAQVPFAASYDADFDNWYTFNGALENCGVKFEPTHWMHLSEPGQAVLGTFDLEALKTLVGEIEEVRGRAA